MRRKYITAVLLVFTVLSQTVLFTSCNDSKSGELQSGDSIHTIALISDTQHYASDKPEVFSEMTDFLVENREKYSIEYVVHAGDLVQHATSTDQWRAAVQAMSKLDNVIPYGVLAGNHDQANGLGRFEAFANCFGEKYCKRFKHFGGSYSNCRAQYQLVTIGSTDFVVVLIGDDPDKGCIDFANEVFEEYPDKVGILCVHKYLSEDLKPDEMGEYLDENVVAPNKNVYMVFCGHESAAGVYSSGFDDDGDGKDDRTVSRIMANYQDAQKDGCMMFLQIDEKAGTLTGISYSPVLDEYTEYEDENTGNFKITIPWTESAEIK